MYKIGDVVKDQFGDVFTIVEVFPFNEQAYAVKGEDARISYKAFEQLILLDEEVDWTGRLILNKSW